MPTLQIYLNEAEYGRLIRLAEQRAATASVLAAHTLAKIVGTGAEGRRLRKALELPDL